MLRFLVLLVTFLVHLTTGLHYHHHQHHLNYNNNHNKRSNDGKILDKLMVVDSKTGIKYNPYSKNHPGRRVCTGQKEIDQPLKNLQQSYYDAPLTLIYETYKNSKIYKYDVHFCCPGWTQIHNRSRGCNNPFCSIPCQNGGSCVKPELCLCPKGFNGQYCEKDRNECDEMKPCDQICHNTYGSYKCECREDFVLQADGQSCQKEDDEDTSLEATDIELHSINHRLFKLETTFKNANQFWADKNQVNKIATNVENMYRDINYLKRSIQELTNLKKDLNIFKNKLLELDRRGVITNEEESKQQKVFKRCAKLSCNNF